MVRTFGHSMRSSTSQQSLNVAPGPGSYRLPSEFGHYETANKNVTSEKKADN